MTSPTPTPPCLREREAVARTIKKAIYDAGPVWLDADVADAILSEHIAPRDAEIERLRAGWDEMLDSTARACAEAVHLKAQLVTLREQLAAAEARAEEAEKQVGELSATVTAWDGAFGIIQSHLQDRIAMNDPARPETYLRIVEASVSELPRISRQIYAATQYRSQSTQAYAERVSDENETLNAALSEERARVAGMRTTLKLTEGPLTHLAKELHGSIVVARALAAVQTALTPKPPHDA